MYAELKRKKRALHRKLNKTYYKEKDFQYDLRKHYNITPNEYWNMYEAQKGNCACCGTHSSNFKRRLHVNHNHITGQVRGLLCTRCNPLMGYAREREDILEMAKNYLNKFKK